MSLYYVNAYILLFSSYHLFEVIYVFCVYICMFAYMWAHVRECGGLRLSKLMLDVLLDRSPHYLLRQGLSLNPDLAFSAALDSRFAPEMPGLNFLRTVITSRPFIISAQILCGS